MTPKPEISLNVRNRCPLVGQCITSCRIQLYIMHAKMTKSSNFL
jgi:hypothetical protein